MGNYGHTSIHLRRAKLLWTFYFKFFTDSPWPMDRVGRPCRAQEPLPLCYLQSRREPEGLDPLPSRFGSRIPEG